MISVFIYCIILHHFSANPPRAHYLCKDFESVIRLVSEPPLCHIVETIWVLGGPEVYKVRSLIYTMFTFTNVN